MAGSPYRVSFRPIWDIPATKRITTIHSPHWQTGTTACTTTSPLQAFQVARRRSCRLNGGFVYNLRNTNNPASARAYINLDVSGMAIWNLRIKNYPLTLRYQVNLPLMGVMFSPHYGQSYYEIFSLGNSSGVIQFTSLHNQPSLRQMLSVDLPIGYTKMRFSYLADLQQSNVNGIKTHTYSHVFMVGFVKDLYRVSNKKRSESASVGEGVLGEVESGEFMDKN